MKRLIPILGILFITSALFLFGCMDTDMPGSGTEEEKSSMEMSLDLKPAFDNDYFVTRVLVTIHKEGYSDSMYLWIDGNHASGTFENIPVGLYRIRVALYADNDLIAVGSGYGEVRAGQTTTAVIYLDFAAGNLEVIVVWGHQCYPHLPSPELVFIGRDCGPLEPTTRNFCYSITNWHEYPPELFTPLPGHPDTMPIPTSRTWVEIYARGGRQIFGFLSFYTPEQLDFFWYAMPPGAPEPDSVYVELWDRECNIRYRSNMVSLAPMDTLQ